MIRYYTYYNCGGYKDFYLGSDADTADASYFVPLLKVWKSRGKPGDAEKIARAEPLQHVSLITRDDSQGLPSECTRLFSHGGYKVIFRTLPGGEACLCIRSIPNDARDSEGREIPFDFLFLADGEESILALDSLALACLDEEKVIEEKIASAITYDPVVNGIRFDLDAFRRLVESTRGEYGVRHTPGRTVFLKLDSRSQLELALREQDLHKGEIDAFFDAVECFRGGVVRVKKKVEEKTETGDSKEDDSKEDVIKEETKEEETDDNVTGEESTTGNNDDTGKETESGEDTEGEKNTEDVGDTEDTEEESEEEGFSEEEKHEILLLREREIYEKYEARIKELEQSLEEERNRTSNDSEEKVENEKKNRLSSLLSPLSILMAVVCLVIGFVLGAVIF